MATRVDPKAGPEARTDATIAHSLPRRDGGRVAAGAIRIALLRGVSGVRRDIAGPAAAGMDPGGRVGDAFLRTILADAAIRPPGEGGRSFLRD